MYLFYFPNFDSRRKDGASRRIENLIKFNEKFKVSSNFYVNKYNDINGKKYIKIFENKKLQFFLDFLFNLRTKSKYLITDSVKFIFPQINKKKILFIYDLRYIEKDQLFLKKFFFYFVYYLSFKFSYLIFCPTNQIKKDLIKFFPLFSNKLKISKFGIDINMNKIPNKYHKKIFDILYVAHFEIRKNHITLINALNKIDKKLKILFIGQNNGLKENLIKLTKNQNHVYQFLTLNDDKKLFEYYSKSKLFIFPSLYEGFGIPLLEAAIFQLPIICSDLNVFKEIGGNELTYFKKDDPDKLSEIIKEKISNNSYKTRYSFVSKYSWNKIINNFYQSL